MEQKEQTKCMGSDGMQKMNGVINADLMTVEEIHQKLDAGYKDMENGRVREASEVFAEFLYIPPIFHWIHRACSFRPQRR